MHFAIPVQPDLSGAARLLACLQGAPGAQDKAEQQQQQQFSDAAGRAATAASSDLKAGGGGNDAGNFSLLVSFAVSVGNQQGAQQPPSLVLRSPAWFERQLPPLPLPAWEPHASLLDFVPHVGELLSRHITDRAPTAALRLELLASLAATLGPPLEVAPSPLAATRAGGGVCTAWRVLQEGQPLLLFVTISASFPADAPTLMLQGLR